MFKDCSDMNASGSHLSNVGRDQLNVTTVGGDQYTAAHQTIMNFNMTRTTASSNELHCRRDSDELRQHDVVSHYHFTRASYLKFPASVLKKLQRKQIGEWIRQIHVNATNK
jgi:hypothetical protein